MKKAILLILGLTVIIFAAAEARQPIDYRRTLFAPLGDRTLLFEAPQGMCFLDESKYSEGMVLSHMQRLGRAEGERTVVAVFADCYKLSSLGSSGEADLLDIGTISWMNPFVGEKSPLPRPDYLDMREVTLRDLTAHSLRRYSLANLDPETRRTDELVAIAYDAQLKLEQDKYQTVGIVVATLIQDFPIDILFTHTSKEPEKDRSALYSLMDKFVTQQIALNRH